MIKVIIGLNALDPNTWETHDAVEDLPSLLYATFGDRFPETGRIFHESIAMDHDVTPKPGDDVSANFLLSLSGTLWVMVYPAGPALGVMALQNVGLLIAALTISWLIKPEGKITGGNQLRQITGSPNNRLGNRENGARVLGRIPDIYGLVRSTPDLLQEVYTTYKDHRETEIAYMCVGRGSYTITDIRDGDMLVGQIEGMSTIVYGPGEIPGGGVPSDVIGEMIDDPVYIVRNVEAVNGQPLLASNAKTFIGDIPYVVEPDQLWIGTGFAYPSVGVGTIRVGGNADEVNDKVKVGDTLEIVYPVDRTNSGDGINLANKVNKLTINGKASDSQFVTLKNVMLFSQNGTGTIPDLTSNATNFVTVTAIDTTAGIFFNTAKLTVSVPAALQPQWELINTYTAAFTPPLQGQIENNGCFITAFNKEWIGPFFVQSPVAPPSEQLIVCNFVAQEGLFADDGKSFKPFTVRIEVEITPVDSSGVPTGDPIQTETTSIIGAALSRNTRAVTMKIVPVTPGNFKIRARRVTRTPWKQDAPSQYRVLIAHGPNAPTGSALALTGPRIPKNPGGENASETDANGDFRNSSYLPFYGQVKDDIRWTHCFTLTTIAPLSFGDITTIHTRTIATEGATSNTKRKLNCLAFRLIQTLSGFPATFGGPRVQDNKAENVLISILTDAAIGGLPTATINLDDIQSAFNNIRAYFGGPTSDGFGGDEAGQFNYTFDDEKLTLEDTVGIVASACFAIPYRQGSIVQARPELATDTAQMLVNHRNKLPGTEQRTVSFGTEADYDGVRLDYVETDLNDPTNDAVRTYTIPPLDLATRPKVLQIPGIRTKKHAAWHAWRAYNKLLYTNTLVEFQACEEAMRLNLQDRFLLSDGTRAPVQDGEVLSISGTTIRTSQLVDITSGGPYTIFLQHTNDTVESIPLLPPGTVTRTLTLASPPSVPLVTDPNLGVRTMYLIVQNISSRSNAFLVSDRSCTGKGTYSITGANYSHAFYWNDGLMFWLPFVQQTGLTLARDWGPYELSTASLGGSTVDPDRGSVYVGSANTEHISITTPNVFASQSYTKSAWIMRLAGVQDSIISSVESTDEQFLLSSTNQVRGVHNNTAYVQFNAPNLIGGWDMYSMSYDAVTLVMKLYVGGILVDTATGVPGRPIGNLRIFGNISGFNGLVGRGDEVRYWNRVLADGEILELYQKTRL